MADRELKPATEEELKTLRDMLARMEEEQDRPLWLKVEHLQRLLDLIDFHRMQMHDLKEESSAYRMGWEDRGKDPPELSNLRNLSTLAHECNR